MRTFWVNNYTIFALTAPLSHTHVRRYCNDVFDPTYKATIGVDFEVEKFQILGRPFSLQL